jgi:glycosyltransferase involved in cell wall biosynthesis
MNSSLDKEQTKICILTSAHLPFDGRVFHKEAKTLAKAGYNVVLIAEHTREETVDGVRIVPLPEPRNRFERMTKVVWKLFRLALKEKANVYHFHDPELIPVSMILKLFGKTVIYDVHEDYAKQILTKDWLGNVCVRRLVAFITNIIEKLGAFLFDGIAAATPDIAEKFNSSKTILIRNFPILRMINETKRLDMEKEKPVIIYVGGLGEVRGTKEIIQSMEFVKDKAELWLLGKWESEEFEKKCKDLDGFKYTKYLGLVPLSEVYKYTKRADIGISILYSIKNYVTSLPIKAYEYMACALPMVMSNFPYWQETFGECTLFADPYNPKDIADKILYLLDNPDKAKQLGDRGRQLIIEKYTWEVESIKLVELYEVLFDTYKKKENY